MVPDPEKIVDSFEAEFTALQQAAQESRDVSGLEEATRQLDETLEALGTMPPGGAEQNAEAATRAAERCQALTKSGKPCKNPPLAGSDFCYVHQEQ
jgi:hypothetical protein